MSPFDFINAIMQSKKNLIVDEEAEKEYVPFIINRGLSYHRDCVLYANEMNRHHFIDKKLQHDFLINSIRSKKRPFVKWAKPEKSDDLECLKTVYEFSESKAREAARILSKEQIQQLKEKTHTGGLRK